MSAHTFNAGDHDETCSVCGILIRSSVGVPCHTPAAPEGSRFEREQRAALVLNREAVIRVVSDAREAVNLLRELERKNKEAPLTMVDFWPVHVFLAKLDGAA